ncbi:hypothetical protein [Streptomyces sp. NBC_00079]|uniref:hypothetical protein n=1 Tax=Streptomyces sp. NBC_00079 TaxID=2975644 RepID=UPI003250B295
MTPPPPRLIRLHLRSRQAGAATLLLGITALALGASHPWTATNGVFAQTLLLLLATAAASVTAASTRTPFGETEHTASAPLSLIRLAHLAVLLPAAAALLTLALATGTFAVSTAALLRNFAGLAGIALLTAALLGPHLCWTLPIAYVVICGNTLDAQITSLWTWPNLPTTDHPATVIAITLLAAGTTAVALTGPRDHVTDRS